jgi:hypothetical protein
MDTDDAGFETGAEHAICGARRSVGFADSAGSSAGSVPSASDLEYNISADHEKAEERV